MTVIRGSDKWTGEVCKISNQLLKNWETSCHIYKQSDIRTWVNPLSSSCWTFIYTFYRVYDVFFYVLQTVWKSYYTCSGYKYNSTFFNENITIFLDVVSILKVLYLLKLSSNIYGHPTKSQEISGCFLVLWALVFFLNVVQDLCWYTKYTFFYWIS